ncbi:hypothetical protein AAVH_22656 [Aphelenchoides avenae]|nr:hypothetical protein AAVH_22656 [Aphelenchus avenae]
MGKKSPKDAKLDGRLLLELLVKQKELMKAKHESAIKVWKDNDEYNFHRSPSMCSRCRTKLF